MKYENVDVNSLKNAIRCCKQTVKYDDLLNLSNEMAGNSGTKVNKKIKNALDSLIEHYKQLNDYLDECSQTAINIENEKTTPVAFNSAKRPLLDELRYDNSKITKSY